MQKGNNRHETNHGVQENERNGVIVDHAILPIHQKTITSNYKLFKINSIGQQNR